MTQRVARTTVTIEMIVPVTGDDDDLDATQATAAAYAIADTLTPTGGVRIGLSLDDVRVHEIVDDWLEPAGSSDD